ncbi:MAG: thiamine phosphate synthase [Desulfobacterota bacterium]|nr:thiamine phosphate synthase [Thermodesulfobacteriota bacterium]
MKYFAITPDTCTSTTVIDHIGQLCRSNVTFLYLRSPLLYNDIVSLAQNVHAAGIVPIVPYRQADRLPDIPHGRHFTSVEHNNFVWKPLRAGIITTASSHTVENARDLLQRGIDYVFLSPVFQPLSKHDDTRPVLPRSQIRVLTELFGERVVLLGGITRQRITQLRNELQHDFSVAGITMFFRSPDEPE